MFFGINLNQALSFPFQDSDSRKHFLIGCLVSLAAFIIPILPFLMLYGYAVRIVRQVLNNESPRMVPWEDWTGMHFPEDGSYVVPGALVPVEFAGGRGVYVEPCVWMRHG